MFIFLIHVNAYTGRIQPIIHLTFLANNIYYNGRNVNDSRNGRRLSGFGREARVPDDIDGGGRLHLDRDKTYIILRVTDLVRVFISEGLGRGRPGKLYSPLCLTATFFMIPASGLVHMAT